LSARLVRSPLATGLALVAATFGWILGQAAWNRGAGPLGSLELTERELALPSFKLDEGTALALEIVLAGDRPAWQRPSLDEPPSPYPWLDRDKLRALGFDVSVDPDRPEADRFYGGALRRRVLLALEMTADGAEPMRSRLAVVDAALDAAELRQRGPGAGDRVIVPGLVRVRVGRPAGQAPALAGQIALEVPFVLVPRRLHVTLDPLRSRESPEDFWRRVRAGEAGPPASEPRYRAVLAFGRLGAPWLVSVEPVGTER